MNCRLDRKSEHYKHCGSCPYITCPCSGTYLDKIRAKRKEKLIGKIVAGFTTEAYYVGVLLSIEISDRNGRVTFRVKEEKKPIRRCNAVYYKGEK
jgi:hypothetical protein